MEDNENMLRLNIIAQEIEKIEQHMQAIEQQSSELEAVKSSLIELDKLDNKDKDNREGKQGKEVLSNLGKGIFIKTEVKDKTLFVNVGKEILVKKSIKETIGIINEQIERLSEGKMGLEQNLNQLREHMNSILEDAQSEHVHDENCEH